MTPTRPVATDDDIEENCVSPTLEVGSVQAQNADRLIDALYLRRSKIACGYLLVEALCNPPAIEDKNIGLPKVHLFLTLSKAMKGSAATWLSQIIFPNMKWVEFKDIFIFRFDTLETCAATILKMFTGKPQEREFVAAYASRLFK
ncbi:unnamed protein product [Parnassius apollo]|uniref:(apollo) hypothetical protein n=1 Tax=Parnassius apollo TaxID=110799 RepID=A0A8S3W9R6_PARAO|nr:unnamed protein product [Parnassius apollo]